MIKIFILFNKFCFIKLLNPHIMKRKLFFLLVTFLSISSFGQDETCETPDDDYLSDLNSITKCSIESTDESIKKGIAKNIAVTVKSRRRIVRKKSAVSGLDHTNLNQKINSIEKKNDITENLKIEKTLTSKVLPYKKTTTEAVLSFNAVDEIPLFKKCKSSPILQQEACFKKELRNHVIKNLRYPKNAYDKGIQGRVLVYFSINKDGSIGEMKITPPYKGNLLIDEAERIVKELPKFIPAKYNGENVAVNYALPISFKIPGVKRTNVKKIIKKENITEVYTFNEVDTLPLFKSCNKNDNNSLECYNSELIKHIENNFAYPQAAVDKNIEGVVNVKFVINKKGDIVNIETKAKGGELSILETSAKMLVEKLSQFTPATKDGKAVNTSYLFPVKFQLN